MNEDPRPTGVPKHQADLLLGPGAFSAFSDVAAYVSGVRSLRLLRPRESETLIVDGCGKMTVTAVRAKHRDLTGRSDAAIGLRIELFTPDEKVCRVGFSGDTSFPEKAEFIGAVARAYANVHLMVVHIGSIYEQDVGEGDSSPQHLGFSGTVRLLEAIKAESADEWDPLVLISEWGEELAPDRSVICEEIAKQTKIKRVFPAEWKQCAALHPGCALPVCARDDRRIADHWHVCEEGHLEYLCPDHDHRTDGGNDRDNREGGDRS